MAPDRSAPSPHEPATAHARLVGDEHVLASAEQREEYAFDAG